MSEKRTKIIYVIPKFGEIVRERWVDILSIGLIILSLILLLSDFWGIIKP
jgi:hypothetical protein